LDRRGSNRRRNRAASTQSQSASQVNLLDAERLLQHYRPDLKRPAVIGSNEFSEEHWKIAYDLAQRLRPALDRLHATQSEIVKRNEADELELKIQSRNGGPWRDFNKDWWNTDKWRSLFDRCRIDPEYPNSDRPSWSKENDHWIFATSQSVEKLLNQLAGIQPDQKPSPEKYKRYPGDDALVTEANKGINSKEYPNAWQAAQTLAPRAEGSETAKVHRLHRKILQSLNILKHRETSRNK
jgi:hypothetical protein